MFVRNVIKLSVIAEIGDDAENNTVEASAGSNNRETSKTP